MKKLLVLLTLLCSTFYLNAARKALVIGNGDYGQNSLSNAAKDARDFAQVLTSVGFKVTLKTDVELKEFEHTVDTFTASLKAVDEVVFYFSGHGIQYSGENFLIPARSDPKSEKDLKWDAMNANRISEYLNKAMVSIMILDCCRDNPFRNVRSSARGMATIEVIPGMQCVFYSTASGKTAEDGRGENSPFTAALLKFVAIPDLELDEVFRNVSKQVKEDTSNRQTPFRSGNLDEYFYFAKSSPVEERKPLDKPAEIPVAIPILSPAGGSYNTAQKVAITCATNGAAIRYTTNNTEPNAASTVYSSPLTVSNTTTIKAKGFKDGWTASPTASATYTITSSGTVATPTFNPLGEAYATAQSVSLSCATDGATIRYTTNNTEPTATSTLYSNPLTVSNTTTIKAKGFKDGWTASPTANATYIISSTPGQMIFVQGDSFKMGSNDGESDEKPVHQVTVSSYYIGKYEVTQKEWTAVM
ncbi:MAG: chitobiase/beta-hexosaminidase C-terminal domain-containing protein, partial [Candidatus Cloacimonadaceae bacterium]|nr:chitobiase/beta-hexosaminidase C-terminal domain-containing protein [Candidatus Cloacimonadaceae bacterium]